MKGFLLTLIIFYAVNTNAQSWEWLKSSTGSDSSFFFSPKIDMDGHGNLYSIGYFTQAATFGNTTLESHHNKSSLYFTKQSSDGNYIFAKMIWADQGLGNVVIKTDAAGNSYLFGTCSGSKIYIGTNDSMLIDPIAYAFGDQSRFFLIKMDRYGNPVWKTIAGLINGSSLTAGAEAITQIGDSIVIAGGYKGACHFLGKFFPSSPANYTGFVCKLDTQFGLRSPRITISNPGYYSYCPTSLTSDGTSIYIAGKFRNTISFGNITLNNPGTGPYGDHIYILKLSSDGTPIWGSHEGGVEISLGDSYRGNCPFTLVCDNSGHLYVGGIYQVDTISNQTTEIEMPFVSKYDVSNGTKLWTVNFTPGVQHFVRGLAVDNNEDVIGVGWYKMDMSLDTFFLPSDNYRAKGMVFKLDKFNGSCTGVTSVGLIGKESSADGIVMRSDKSEFFITGRYLFQTGIDSFSVASGGIYGCFNAKYSFGPPTSIRNHAAAQFSLYPNPANDQLVLEMKSALKGEVYIYNALGQQVYQKSINSASTLLDIQNLAPGSYYLKGIFGEQTATQRFTKN